MPQLGSAGGGRSPPQLLADRFRRVLDVARRNGALVHLAPMLSDAV